MSNSAAMKHDSQMRISLDELTRKHNVSLGSSFYPHDENFSHSTLKPNRIQYINVDEE
jgi:hypothetical protein